MDWEGCFTVFSCIFMYFLSWKILVQKRFDNWGSDNKEDACHWSQSQRNVAENSVSTTATMKHARRCFCERCCTRVGENFCVRFLSRSWKKSISQCHNVEQRKAKEARKRHCSPPTASIPHRIVLVPNQAPGRSQSVSWEHCIWSCETHKDQYCQNHATCPRSIGKRIPLLLWNHTSKPSCGCVGQEAKSYQDTNVDGQVEEGKASFLTLSLFLRYISNLIRAKVCNVGLDTTSSHGNQHQAAQHE